MRQYFGNTLTHEYGFLKCNGIFGNFLFDKIKADE